MQGAEKMYVVKPVASRPLSKLTSYPHLMAEATNYQTPSSSTEKTIAIKPKTVRFRPWTGSVPEAVPSKNGIASSEKASVTNFTADLGSSFFHKPAAKTVSATKASPLVNLIQDSFDGNCHGGNMNMQAPRYETNLSHQHNAKEHQNSSSYADISQICEPSRTSSQDMELDMKIQNQSGDKLAYDGYNWRKYGQKQVKGSEYPRSYYKCTHPNCPVKKNVERSLNGQIAEIVYKGEHNHTKPPQSLKKLSLSSQGQSVVSDEHTRGGNLLQAIPPGWNTSAGMMNNYNGMGVHLTANCDGRMSDQLCKAGSRAAHVDGDKLDYKRRRDGDQISGASIDRSDGAGCNPITQNPTDTDILGDGFHWRKYGQKVVKGNSYPRSYYRCTNPRCNVRKYVERVSDESGSFVTRYEGRHNHEMPNRK